MTSEKNKSKKNWIKRWFVLSFLFGFTLFGGFWAWVIWADEMHRPGSSENIWLEMIYGTCMFGVPAGLVIVAIVYFYRWFNRLAK